MKKDPKFYCPQCSGWCAIEQIETMEYEAQCRKGHKWSVTIDIDHPTTGGRIIGFQCNGAKAENFFK